MATITAVAQTNADVKKTRMSTTGEMKEKTAATETAQIIKLELAADALFAISSANFTANNKR